MKVAVTDESIEVEFCLGREQKQRKVFVVEKLDHTFAPATTRVESAPGCLASCWSTETACPNLRVFWRGEKKCLKREEGQ